MATAALVPVQEYPGTACRPDCEYIDGQVRERKAGETDHSRLPMLLAGFLYSRETLWGIRVLPGQRVQVKASRFRVPDISVVLGPLPTTPILREPPFLCIEILSREDSMSDMQERIDDCLGFGVQHVWVVDPRTRRAFLYTTYTTQGMREAKDGILRTANPDIEVPMPGLE